MSQTKTLRQRIQAGEVLVALRGSVTMSQRELAHVWSQGKYDYIWIDGQHTAFSEEQLVNYCAAAEALGIDVQLRIPHTRHAHLCGRYLDLGACKEISIQRLPNKIMRRGGRAAAPRLAGCERAAASRPYWILISFYCP